MGNEDPLAELRDRLWAEGPRPSVGADQSALMEQYKLYVEMADHISQRRAVANAFFLSLNTAVFALAGGSWPTIRSTGPEWWFALPAAALVSQCLAWFYLVRSYRQVNAVKYQVIGALEERLPASPYWRAEWWALGEGRDRNRYWPLSHVEQWVPMFFGSIYLLGLAGLFFFS